MIEVVLCGVKLIVFLEYLSYFVDFLDESFVVNVEDFDGMFVMMLIVFVVDFVVVIVVGFVECVFDEWYVCNMVVVVWGDGVFVVYCK